MEKHHIYGPIGTVFDGTNYLTCQSNKEFLIGRKLWYIVVGDIVKPI